MSETACPHLVTDDVDLVLHLRNPLTHNGKQLWDGGARIHQDLLAGGVIGVKEGKSCGGNTTGTSRGGSSSNEANRRQKLMPQSEGESLSCSDWLLPALPSDWQIVFQRLTVSNLSRLSVFRSGGSSVRSLNLL